MNEGPKAPKTEPPSQALGGSELLALLDREIEFAHRRSHRPGWTPWALLTALAALLWGVASRVDHVSSVPVVFRAAVVTLFVFQVLRGGRRLVAPSGASDEEGRVLVSSDVLGEQRPALLLELIYGGALLWGIARFSGDMPMWAEGAVLIAAAHIALSAVVGLVYSAWPVPFPVGVPLTSPARLLLQLLPILLPALGGIGYMGTIDGRQIEDVRVGALLAAAALALLELAREPDDPPLVGELVEVRRDVSLGAIGVAEGVERTTILLRGLKLEDYVQQDARRMLRAMKSLEAAITDFRPVLEEIDRHATLLELKHAPDGQAWHQLMEVWSRKGDEAERRFKRAEAWQRRYAIRLKFAATLARIWHVPYEGQELVATIRPKVESATDECRTIMNQYRAALARLERALRAAGLMKLA